MDVVYGVFEHHRITYRVYDIYSNPMLEGLDRWVRVRKSPARLPGGGQEEEAK